MNLAFGLEAGLAQKQMQTAQMIQVMTIIQQNALQLEQYIRQEVEINPLLEISQEENVEYEEESAGIRDDDEFCFDEEKMDGQAALQDGFEYGDELRSDETYDEEKRNYVESLNVYSKTLEEKLKEQIIDMNLSKIVQKIAIYLIGELDENGFLNFNYDEMKNRFDTNYDNVEQAVEAIQNCEPTGVGAANIKESLLLQLDKMGYDDDDLEYKIIQNCWDMFIHGKITSIARKYEIEPSQIQEAMQIIKQLNLSPAKEEETDDNEAIIPDLIVRYESGVWKVAVNDEFLPNLEINQQYSDMLRRQFKADKNTKEFIRDRFNKANWLINAIEQRRMTIIATMYAIIKRQSNFFSIAKSERALIPMNLADIAKDTGLDESTVSRVTNGKFATTPFGMFELKYFFSEVVIKNKQNEDGGDISTTKIKEKLRQLIEEEDKTQPLSDQQLAQDLEKTGLAAARRTVAKYREQLGFATARLRKVY
ncbi:MAG: RNA polymerase factor sigma-54 [Chitinivibrionia bacterium]|nr:RNA polymerase factor sigma-54 [Chitinivibrionia bacterium]